MFEYNCNDNRRDKSAEDHQHQKCQIQNYQNKDRLSVCRIFYYSVNLNWTAQNRQLGRMRPAGLGLDIAALDPISGLILSKSWDFNNELQGGTRFRMRGLSAV